MTTECTRIGVKTLTLVVTKIDLGVLREKRIEALVMIEVEKISIAPATKAMDAMIKNETANKTKTDIRMRGKTIINETGQILTEGTLSSHTLREGTNKITTNLNIAKPKNQAIMRVMSKILTCTKTGKNTNRSHDHEAVHRAHGLGAPTVQEVWYNITKDMMKGRIVQILVGKDTSLLSIDHNRNLAPIHMTQGSTLTENNLLDLQHTGKIMVVEITILVEKKKTTKVTLKTINEARLKDINSLTVKVVAASRGGKMSQ